MTLNLENSRYSMIGTGFMYEQSKHGAGIDQLGRCNKLFLAIHVALDRSWHSGCGDYINGLKILPHGSLKTWGEPCNVRFVRHYGVMTAAPAEAGHVPIVKGAWQI